MKNFVFVLIMFFGANAFSQEHDSTKFVLDPSKPYVYLKFDHIGPRKSHPNGEDDAGLWLRLVNNCRLPIVLRASGGYPGEPGVALEDEVVEQEQGIQIISDQDSEDFQRREELRKARLKHKPEGYTYEVSGVVRVQPGKDILFSVPLSHVDEFWYMRVKFALDLDKSSIAIGPFTYLPFFRWNIPKEERQTEPQPGQQLKK